MLCSPWAIWPKTAEKSFNPLVYAFKIVAIHPTRHCCHTKAMLSYFLALILEHICLGAMRPPHTIYVEYSIAPNLCRMMKYNLIQMIIFENIFGHVATTISIIWIYWRVYPYTYITVCEFVCVCVHIFPVHAFYSFSGDSCTFQLWVSWCS